MGDASSMPTRTGFLDYVAAAFNARPLGMFVAPNWIGLAALGLLGVSNPGFWVLGAGLEIGYLVLLSTNGRFQRLVAARRLSGARGDWDRRIQDALARLNERDRRRYTTFAERCRSIIDLQLTGTSSIPHGVEAQTDSLGRLSWMYLKLLVAQDVITDVLGETGDGDAAELARRQASLRRQLENPDLNPELRRSLDGQTEILGQRLDRRTEAQRKLTYIEAELSRMEQQVELIREQAALSTDPERLSQQIDDIAATLGGTSQWIHDQQQVYGAMEDLLSEPPPVTIGGRTKEHQ
jgi:hypothetical protein